jgi:hypothetical protein
MSFFIASIQGVPPLWQWIGLGATVIALVVGALTLPSAFQMWWGRPKLTIGFTAAFLNDQFVLHGHIRNEPISCKILRAIGVRRDETTISAQYGVADAATNQHFPDRRVKLNVEQGQVSYRVVLASGLPAVAVFVSHTPGQANAVLLAQDVTHENIPLPPGRYNLTLRVYDQAGKIARTESFVVGEEANQLRWLLPPKKFKLVSKAHNMFN